MEKGQKRPLINELTQGRELANQLKDHLDKTISPEACDCLLDKILSSYEKALSMLNWTSAFVDTSQDSDPVDSKKNVCKNKKRKTMANWSEQVKVCSGTMVEAPLNDGYSWRKYGQKDILGATYPRAYYRCTHRHVQGCLATKQVQRTDEDSSVFEVTYKGRHTCIEATYKGRHTCIEATQLSQALASKEEKEILQASKEMASSDGFDFNSSERVEASEEEIFPYFSFPLTPIESQSVENLFFEGCDLPDFTSHAHNLESSDSDLIEMINSTPNSLTSSDCDLSFYHMEDFLNDITDSEICF